ncbi:MAG: GRAM domain-containing protein [Negativicutes bacterium]
MQKFNYEFPLKDDEKIIHKERANMHDSDYVLNGALYLTNQRIVFIALVPKRNTKVTYTILLSNIKDVIPEKSLFFFNNILRVVSTLDEQYKFVVKGQKEWQTQILQQISQIRSAVNNQS